MTWQPQHLLYLHCHLWSQSLYTGYAGQSGRHSASLAVICLAHLCAQLMVCVFSGAFYTFHGILHSDDCSV